MNFLIYPPVQFQPTCLSMNSQPGKLLINFLCSLPRLLGPKMLCLFRVFCPVPSSLVGSSPVCSALVGSRPVCSAWVGSSPVCSTLASCSASSASSAYSTSAHSDVIVLPCLFSHVLIPARVPGLSLCLALFDIVCRSQTYACPRITLCLAIYIYTCSTHACFRPCLLIKPCKWILMPHAS